MTTDPPAGRSALITGASRGIGRGIALALAERGRRLINEIVISRAANSGHQA